MINQKGLDLIKRFEGCRLKAYRCPSGVPTIGYGSTGKHVHMDMTITQDVADALLRKDLSRFESAVSDCIDGAPTNDNEFSAMVSLAFNIGEGNFAISSVLKFHREGNNAKAAASFLLWDKAGGRVLPGLVNRRKAEADLYLETCE